MKQMFIVLFKCPGDLVKSVWHVQLFLCYSKCILFFVFMS